MFPTDNPILAHEAHSVSKFQSPKAEAAAYELVSLMSDISEDHYAAGWLHGLEYSLFGVAYAGEQFGYGLGHDEIAQLISLSQACQGWWKYGATGREFVPMDEWLVEYGLYHSSQTTY